MNKKVCYNCNGTSFSSKGPGFYWQCPHCGKDITNEPVMTPNNKEESNKIQPKVTTKGLFIPNTGKFKGRASDKKNPVESGHTGIYRTTKLVDPRGLEPLASRVRFWCSPN